MNIEKNEMTKLIKIDLDEVREYIKNTSPDSKIYFGADSERVQVDNVWHVDYLLCVIVHIDGNHGAKIFGHVDRERDYDKKLDRPKLRLMTEVFKIAELYLKLADDLEDREASIHLDLNPKAIHGSSCAVSEAVGYIRGVCGLEPVIKPHSWCASNVADAVKRLC